MLGTLILGCALTAQSQFDFRTFGPYESKIPVPSKILSYEIGSKHTVFRDQERVLNSIALADPTRIKSINFGESTEGRTLRILAISSPENLGRLEEIRLHNQAIANGHPVPSENSPAIVWINQCIHGDETASFESAMELIYTLVASRHSSVEASLKNVVVLVNPVYNPDGHERYVVAYNSIPNGNPEPGSYDSAIPSAFTGRANHYRFDLNRDRIAMSQAETRQEVAEFLRWNPHVYVDQHGQTENYFFPPVQQSINVNVGRDRYNHWTDIFGRATASSFDRDGWTYYIRDAFDLYNSCYLDSHTSLMGAIGMTHETDGGRVVTRRRSDDTLLTLRDGVIKHFTSAMAVIESAAKNQAELVKSFAEFKESSVSGKHAGKFKRVVLESEDPRQLSRFAAHLQRTGISFIYAAEGWSQPAHNYWTSKREQKEFSKGALVIDMAQPQGPLAKALLEPMSHFEKDFIARQKAKYLADNENRKDPVLDSFEFYDSTAWCLPYAYNLDAWWCEAAPGVKSSTGFSLEEVQQARLSTVGYWLKYTDQSDILYVASMLSSGVKVSLTTRDSKVGGETIPAGSFLFLKARNQAGLEEKLFPTGNPYDVFIRALSTSYPDAGRQGPGSENVIQLRKPKIGIAFGAAGTLRGGALWFLMEQEFKMPFHGLTNSLTSNISEYSCIVIPGGSVSPQAQAFAEAGGTVVLLGGTFEPEGTEFTKVSSEPSLPGAFFKASLDKTHFLGFGYQRDEISVPIDGREFFKAPEGGSPVRLGPAKAKKLLSGWVWDETEKQVADTTWLYEVQVGRGRVVVFPQDPTHRAQYPGLYKLLLNAMILGPSM